MMHTAHEAAHLLGISVETIMRWLRTGKIQGEKNMLPSKTGSRLAWYVSQDEVDRIIAKTNAPPALCSVCGIDPARERSGLCRGCANERTLEDRHKRNATYIIARSERFTLRPIVGEYQEQIALMAVLQAYAVSQISEEPLVALEELHSVLETLGVLREGDDVKELLEASEAKGWLRVSWQVDPPQEIQGGDDDHESMTDVCQRTGFTYKHLTKLIHEGKIDGVKKKHKGKSSPWMIPRGWEPKENDEER